ncbi:MAG: DUF416 family protein [Janthinobacterium lividum]
MNPLEPLLFRLPITHQAVLAALTCEKMLPAISRFDEPESKRGRPLFEEAIAAMLAFGLSRALPITAYQQLQDQLAAFWPDLDKSDNDFASYAFDACGALSEALLLVEEQGVAHLLNCLTAATDTVDMYVQDLQELTLSPGDLNAFIDASPTMKQERHRQQVLTQELLERAALDDEFLTHLRQLNEQAPLVDFARLPPDSCR